MPENQVMKYQNYFQSQRTDAISNIYFSIKRKEIINGFKSNLKLESSTFRPTFMPTIWVTRDNFLESFLKEWSPIYLSLCEQNLLFK
jgi:hypothetical protein